MVNYLKTRWEGKQLASMKVGEFSPLLLKEKDSPLPKPTFKELSMKVPKVAEILNVHKLTVYQAIRLNHIPHIHVSEKNIRVTLPLLKKFMEGKYKKTEECPICINKAHKKRG